MENGEGRKAEVVKRFFLSGEQKDTERNLTHRGRDTVQW